MVELDELDTFPSDAEHRLPEEGTGAKVRKDSEWVECIKAVLKDGIPNGEWSMLPTRQDVGVYDVELLYNKKKPKVKKCARNNDLQATDMDDARARAIKNYKMTGSTDPQGAFLISIS